MCSICDEIASGIRKDCGCENGCDCGPVCGCGPEARSSTSASELPKTNLDPPNFLFPPPFDLGGGDSGTDGAPVVIEADPDDPNYQLMVDTHEVMSPGRMDKLMREFFEHLMVKCQKKNKAYAETDATSDALNNFREAALDYDITMTKYAHILQGKHYRAFKTWMRTGEAPDKPFRILGDIIVYAFIMYCIGVDEGTWKHEQEVLEDGD